MEKSEFINMYKKNFGRNIELKLKFEMGGNHTRTKRIKQVLQRFKEVSNYVFKGKEVWVLLVIWDAEGENKMEFKRTGFDKELASEYFYGGMEDERLPKNIFDEDVLQGAEFLYIMYNSYSFNNVLPIVYSKAGFELGLDGTAGILAYFMSFGNRPVLLNLYDDRGMELLSNSHEAFSEVSKKFSKYII